MAEIRMRLNLDAEEVEVTVDGTVAISSGQDVFKSWVDAYNDKHKPAIVEPSANNVVDVTAAETVETSVEEPVDNDSGE